MKLSIAIFVSIIALAGCSSEPKGLTVIERYDRNLSLMRDKQDKLYFQSAVSEECGGGFWFSNLATFDDGKDDVKYELSEEALERIIDLEILKFDQVSDNYKNYNFQDRNNSYTVFITMCENTVAYSKNPVSTINPED